MKICFNGCSFTVGEGFPLGERINYIYTNLLAKKFRVEQQNIAIGGSSNHTIFMRSVLQNKFLEVDQTKWVNLFESFQKNTIDVGPEGHHPGIKSHQWMANQIANYIIENKII